MPEAQSEHIDRQAPNYARRRGAQAAETFAERLERIEVAEREALISQWSCLSNGGASPSPGCEDAAMILRLKSEIEGLRQFRHAVLHSKGWRLLQLARRLVGRAW